MWYEKEGRNRALVIGIIAITFIAAFEYLASDDEFDIRAILSIALAFFIHYVFCLAGIYKKAKELDSKKRFKWKVESLMMLSFLGPIIGVVWIC